jgi:hypothetical protein
MASGAALQDTPAMVAAIVGMIIVGTILTLVATVVVAMMERIEAIVILIDGLPLDDQG